MKQSLSIKLGQQLKMTPQLQQAIRLLQLSTLELEQEIQDCIDGNPMLETEDDWADSADDTSAESGDNFSENEPSLEPLDSASAENNGSESGTDFDDDYTTGDLDPVDLPDNYGEEMVSNDISDATIDGATESEVSDQLHEPLADDIPVDSNWDDIYPQTPSGASGDSDYDAGANDSAEETLKAIYCGSSTLRPWQRPTESLPWQLLMRLRRRFARYFHRRHLCDVGTKQSEHRSAAN